MDYKQAQYLIGVKKKILIDGKAQDEITICQKSPMRLRYELVSTENDEYAFLLQIAQSTKNMIRISLHCQDEDSKIGLIRVDYNAGHVNPEIVTENLPEIFLPYVGKRFEDEEHHVHYHVDGYKSLAWAVPIDVTDIAAREIHNDSFVNDICSAIQEFARLINLETMLYINRTML